MPTVKPKVAQVTVGGTKYALTDVEAAITVLEKSAGIMVKQPLAKAGNPLAAMDYHSLASSWRASHEQDAKAQTKPCVIAALRDLVAKATKPIAAKPTVAKTTAPAA